MDPLVSIKIASYNHADFIGQTIKSVLDQTYANFELIIVDDCSTDDSLEVIRTFSDPRITLLVNERNIGAAATSLRAKALLKGEYFCSLDSDDYFHPEKLAKQVDFMRTHPETDALATFAQEVDVDGSTPADQVATDWFNRDMDFNLPENWLWENHLCHSSVLMKREVHDRLWAYESGLPFTNDWHNWIRFLANGATFGMLPERLTYYRIHSENITHKNPKRRFWEYAYISSRVFHPYLRQKRLHELLTQNLSGFLRHPQCPQNWSERRFLLQLLLHDTLADVNFETVWNAGLRDANSTMQQFSLEGVLDSEEQLWSALETWRNDVERERTNWQAVASDREKIIRLTVLPRLLRFLFRKLQMNNQE